MNLYGGKLDLDHQYVTRSIQMFNQENAIVLTINYIHSDKLCHE